jgi:hypothetical protein
MPCTFALVSTGSHAMHVQYALVVQSAMPATKCTGGYRPLYVRNTYARWLEAVIPHPYALVATGCHAMHICRLERQA